MNIPFPDMAFDKYKVELGLVPTYSKDGGICLVFKHKMSKNIAYTILYDNAGGKLFSPWYVVKDRFGGDVRVNESISMEGAIRPKIIPFDRYAGFIYEPVSRFPVWFGYFDNIYQLNREWKKHGVDMVLDRAKYERMLTPELENAVQGFKFEKTGNI